MVRGGRMELEHLSRNAEEHHANPHTPDEWALSVAFGPDPAQIVADCPFITQHHYRWTSARRLVEAGFVLVEDEPPHALLLLPGPVTAEMATELRSLFDQEEENPFYRERKSYGGRKR